MATLQEKFAAMVPEMRKELAVLAKEKAITK